MNREWSELFSAARDESLTEENLQRLEEILKSEPGARTAYLRFMQLHSLLENRPTEVDEAELEQALSTSKVVRLSRPVLTTWLAAAAIVAVALVLGLQSAFKDQEPADLVATLLFAEKCEWDTPGSQLAEGQRLAPGQIWLKSGAAVIRLDGGAEVILTGDTKLQLQGVARAQLMHGDVVVRAEDGAEGFLLSTPSCEFIDLGTEFAVRTKPGGETELHVHEGAVAVGETVYEAGEAVRFERTRNAPAKKVNTQAPRFDEMVRRSNPRERRDLMTAYEGFYMEEGEYQPNEIIKGKGWSSPWRLRTPAEYGQHDADTSKTMRIAKARMNMAWPVRGGRQGMLEMPPGRNIRLRQLSRPLDLSGEGITFLSFLVADQRLDTPESKHSFRITFRSSENYFGEALSLGWSKDGAPRIMTGGGPMRRGFRQIPSNETVFCVAKITASERNRDEVLFRFYRESDHLDIFEPADWDIEMREADLSARLNLLLISSQGQSTTYVDELRIGPTWRSVTPLDKP